jgi:hypothetical protein
MKLCCSLIKERTLLILDLLKSLDPAQDAEIENAWLSGAEKKRYVPYFAGETKPRSALDVFTSIQAQLQ